jgi:hypothetical protein
VGAFRGIRLIYNIVDGIQRVSFDEKMLRESGGFRELWDMILTSPWRICRRGTKMRGLDGSIILNKVVRHLNLSVLPAHARDIFTWKMWKSGGPDRFIVYFCYFTMFLLRAFPIVIIMRRFWLDFGLMFIHRDIYTNRQCHILGGGGGR